MKMDLEKARTVEVMMIAAEIGTFGRLANGTPWGQGPRNCTHQAELLLQAHGSVFELCGVHAENGGDEGKGKLGIKVSHCSSNKSKRKATSFELTKMIVKTVNTMMDCPWFSVSEACLTASRASITPACCCLRVRRSLSCGAGQQQQLTESQDQDEI